jgi:hypothetical protein
LLKRLTDVVELYLTLRSRRGCYAIHDFLDAWNEHPEPFVGTATVDSVVEKRSRCRQTLAKGWYKTAGANP